MGQARVSVRRSPRDTAFAVGVAVPLVVLAAWAGAGGRSVVAFVCGALAACVLLLASLAAYEAPCPSCGRVLHHLLGGANEYVRCGWCARYARGEGGELWPMELEHVAEEPVFALELSAETSLPKICCVCASPATREEEVSATVRELEGGRLSTPAANARYAVKSPHCDRHEGGARLTRENVAPTTGFSKEAVGAAPRLANVLKVRSYRFYVTALENLRAS